MTVTIASVAASVAADIKAFRSSAVTAENKGDVSARSFIASLLSGQWTEELAVSGIIHAFGNPKSPKSNKPVQKLSGLRDFTGGDAVRKMAETSFRIIKNVDADKAREVEGQDGNPVTIGDGTIRKLVTAFVLSASDAPKSLRALDNAVRDALKAFAKAQAEAEGADNADAEAETTAEANAPAPFDVADALAKLAVYAASMDMDGAMIYTDAFNAVAEAWDNRIAALNADAEAAPMAEAA